MFQKYQSSFHKAHQIIQSAQQLNRVLYTPLIESPFLNNLCGFRLLLKCENLQIGGAFKTRGAYVKCSNIVEQYGKHKNIVAFSSGNHAWAVAMASHYLQLNPTIIMPHDAPMIKRQTNGIFYKQYHKF